MNLGLAPSSISGIITAASTFVGALTGLLIVLLRVLPLLRSTDQGVQDVHKIVNQQRTDAANYSNLLAERLRESGIEVPGDISLDPDPPVIP
jgi:hypothetical protein